MALNALIFDVDGTLADTERDGHRVAFNAAFREHGLDWHWDVDLYGKLLTVAGGKERIRYFFEQFRKNEPRPRDFADLVIELHKSKTRHYVERLVEGDIPLRPGVERLLKEALEQGVRLAIATTTTPDNVIALLRSGLGPDAGSWFDVIAAGDIVPAKKPAPDIYLWALREMGLAASDCLVVEDSENGIKASLGAGIATLITANSYTVEHDFTGALAVLSDLGEPRQPFQVLAGNAHGRGHVDLELVRRWHALAH